MEYETFIKGEKAILDKEFRNSSMVEVRWQTPNRMFTCVRDGDGGEWRVMTDRLTKIKMNLQKEI